MLFGEELEICGVVDRAGLFLQGDEAGDLRLDGLDDQFGRVLAVEENVKGRGLDESALAVGVRIGGRGRPVQLRHPFAQRREDGPEELRFGLVLLSLHDPRRDTRRQFALGKPLQLAIVDGVHGFLDGLQHPVEIVEGLPGDHHRSTGLLDAHLLFFTGNRFDFREAGERVVERGLATVPDGRVFRCQIVELHGAMSFHRQC